MRTSPFRRLAVSTAAAVTLAGGGLVALAVPAEANHVGTIAVSQAGGQGAYVTLQVDLTYTGGTSGGGSFTWRTGDGRSGSVSDGVSNGAYLGDGSGTGYLSGGSGVLATYSWTRTQPAPNVARTRLTYAYAQAGVYTVDWSGCCPDASGSLPVSSQASLPPCSNTLDDDGDGNTDYPADPGCQSPEDVTEGPSCPPFAGFLTVCLTPGEFVQRVAIHNQDVKVDLDGGPEVVGYLETYRFTVANVSVNLPCVRLVIENAQAVHDPCARAGGTKIDSQVLVARDTPSATVTPGAVIAETSICKAELVVLAGTLGVSSAPAYTQCEAGQVSL